VWGLRFWGFSTTWIFQTARLGKARGEFSLVVGWAGYNAPFSFTNAFLGDCHQLSVPLAFVDPGINHTTRDWGGSERIDLFRKQSFDKRGAGKFLHV
jgi:hypothetical protein